MASYQLYWGFAIAGSVFFLLRTLLFFVGFDDGHAHGDVYHDTDTGMGTEGSFHILSLTSLSAFIMAFGWLGAWARRAVADGIHNLAEPRDRFGHAGNLTVHPVGGSRDGIDDDRDDAIVIRHKQVQKYQREDQAREGNEIGDRKDLIRRVIGSADKLLFDLLFDAHRTPPLVNDKTFDTIPVPAMSIQRSHRESRHVEGASGLRWILHLCTSASKSDIFRLLWWLVYTF